MLALSPFAEVSSIQRYSWSRVSSINISCITEWVCYKFVLVVGIILYMVGIILNSITTIGGHYYLLSTDLLGFVAFLEGPLYYSS